PRQWLRTNQVGLDLLRDTQIRGIGLNVAFHVNEMGEDVPGAGFDGGKGGYLYEEGLCNAGQGEGLPLPSPFQDRTDLEEVEAPPPALILSFKHRLHRL